MPIVPPFSTTPLLLAPAPATHLHQIPTFTMDSSNGSIRQDLSPKASNRTTDSSRADTGFEDDMTDSRSGKRRNRNAGARTASSRSNDGDSANSGICGKGLGTINRNYHCGFVDTCRCKEFKAKYNYKSFNMNEFLDWVCAVGGGADAPEPVRELYANSMKWTHSKSRK